MYAADCHDNGHEKVVKMLLGVGGDVQMITKVYQ